LLDLRGVDYSLGSLVWGGTVTNNGISSPATLSVGSDNTSTTFKGIIQDGTSATSLTKTGTGTLTLASTNIYTGGTALEGGTLALSASGAAGAGPIIFELGSEALRIENTALSSNTFANTIDSLGESDVIDLSGLFFVAGATAIFAADTHTLMVTSNGITDTLILTNPRGTAFNAISDGTSGTEIVLIPTVTESLASDTGCYRRIRSRRTMC
jgi:autotransporter-associated beta strand protein